METQPIIHPDRPGLQSFWAYIHTDDRSKLRIKRLIPQPWVFTGDGKDELNDLEHALWEKDNGNTNILIIVPHIIWADTPGGASILAVRWLTEEGYDRSKRGDWVIPRVRNRFAHLMIE